MPAPRLADTRSARLLDSSGDENDASARKRRTGRFYTAVNPFRHRAFREWAKAAGLPARRILEPFAGSNRLIEFLEEMDLCRDFRSFDIAPADSRVRRRDTLRSFPSGYEACVTNPPWLARNSAAFRGLPFPRCSHDDLYKFCLEKCLSHCPWVAALLPESFLRSGLFRTRLRHFVSLTARMFTDTGHPAGLALFGPDWTADAVVWADSRRIGALSDLERLRPRPTADGPPMRFNDPHGNVGLIALDDTRTASIRFCDVRELAGYRVKKTGRHITRITVRGPVRIEAWNAYLGEFRERTQDVLMTSYKGIRKDGKYRRRLDWRLARGIVHHA